MTTNQEITMNTDYDIDTLNREFDDHPYDVKSGAHFGAHTHVYLDSHADHPEFLRIWQDTEKRIVIEAWGDTWPEFTAAVARGEVTGSHSITHGWNQLARINTRFTPVEAAVGLLRGYTRAYSDQTAGV